MSATAVHPISHVSSTISSPSSVVSRTDWFIVPAVFGDAIVIAVALFISFYERLSLPIVGPFKDVQLDKNAHVMVLGMVLYLVIYQINGAYVKHRFLHRAYSFRITFKTSVVWGAAFLVLTLGFELQPTISRIFVALAVLNTWIFLFVWRMLFRRALYMLNLAFSLRRRVVVVGWSQESDILVQQIENDPFHPYELVGCTPTGGGRFHVDPPASVPILGTYSGLSNALREQKPDVLILADLDPPANELMNLAQLCMKEHVQFTVIPSFFQIFASGLAMESISGVPVVGISRLPLDQFYNRMIKHVVDKIGAIVGLLLSAPLILVFGILIYRESPGPIFYSQRRSGRNGRVFKIYKLRSMKLNAEANGPHWTKENDPRRLKVGEFMRRTNIDEIPQFWNVLMGQMSLVGPRPERPELVQNFKEEIAHYNARHCAKPGMTGYAQVNGLRGNTDLRERIRYDLYYLENWSLWLDTQIMFKTLFVRTNAY
jgi:exopolysaccharide biosynthesis polyprenyl glycosylphosphotransferase